MHGRPGPAPARPRRPRLRRPLFAALGALAATVPLAACAPPSYRYEASESADIAFRVPRTWTEVRAGAPTGKDGTPETDGSWQAVFDSSAKPSFERVRGLTSPALVAIVRTWVVTPDTVDDTTPDGLRDKLVPVTDSGRAVAAMNGFPSAPFRLISDHTVTSPTSQGVVTSFRYDFDSGPEVYEKVAVTDRQRKRIHMLLLHCSEQCFDASRSVIEEVVSSFTVRQT